MNSTTEIYFRGKGLTVKLKPDEINNLYRPTSIHKIESFDYVSVQDSLVKKFAPVLLKEWFSLLKPKGYLVINYIETKDVNFDSVEKLFWWLFRANYNYNIVLHQKKGSYTQIIVQKKKTMFAKGDSIEKWSFGIVTNGKRDDWVKQIIASIRSQKIPQYEIIICGKYTEHNERDIVYIDFNERSEIGWITKKKNLILEKAKFENLCVIHDRLVFNKDWYEGMKKYGNAFEIIGCVQLEKGSTIQAGDWLTHGGPSVGYRIARMHYTDWDYFTYLSGQLVITKKSLWKNVLWNETKSWYDGDDVDTSFRARDMGYIIRFNPYASLTALAWDHGKIPLKYNREEGLLPKDMLVRRIARLSVDYFYRLPYGKEIFGMMYKYFAKTPLYKKFIYQ